MALKNDWQAQNQRLEDIISQLNNQSVDIEKATHLYKEALEIIKQLETQIQKAKNEIKQVKK